MKPEFDPKARAEELFLQYIAERDLSTSDAFDAFTHEHPEVQAELRRLGANFMVMEERLEVAYPSLMEADPEVKISVNYVALTLVVAAGVAVGVVARMGFGASVGAASVSAP